MRKCKDCWKSNCGEMEGKEKKRSRIRRRLLFCRDKIGGLSGGNHSCPPGAGCGMRGALVSGGVAPLNHRLQAAIHYGMKPSSLRASA